MTTQQDKVWLITGSSSGFGREMALEALAQGARVVATARDVRVLDELVARAPERVLPLALDVTKLDQIERAIAAAYERFGAVDVLVNNAGYSFIGAVEETSDAELRLAFETMFFGLAALTRAVLPKMRERGAGTIVQITSVGGLSTAPGFSGYCAVKHAVEGFSEALSAEVAPFGVRVLIVEPGAFRTSLFGSAFRSLPELPAYDATVGNTRRYARDAAGKQPGDPSKAARAIVEAVAAGAPTLRLPLGADAVSALRAKLVQVTADLDHNEAVAVATAFTE
jgi:NAD(P)-dependent dehydrogenase (short-subunit alcohol dehydrogenase family)